MEPIINSENKCAEKFCREDIKVDLRNVIHREIEVDIKSIYSDYNISTTLETDFDRNKTIDVKLLNNLLTYTFNYDKGEWDSSQASDTLKILVRNLTTNEFVTIDVVIFRSDFFIYNDLQEIDITLIDKPTEKIKVDLNDYLVLSDESLVSIDTNPNDFLGTAIETTETSKNIFASLNLVNDQWKEGFKSELNYTLKNDVLNETKIGKINFNVSRNTFAKNIEVEFSDISETVNFRVEEENSNFNFTLINLRSSFPECLSSLRIDGEGKVFIKLNEEHEFWNNTGAKCLIPYQVVENSSMEKFTGNIIVKLNAN